MHYLPQRSSELEIEDTGSDVLVHDKRTQKIHILNRTAGAVLRACDGKTAVQALALELFPEHPNQAEADIAKVLADFSKLGLLSA